MILGDSVTAGCRMFAFREKCDGVAKAYARWLGAMTHVEL